jgi:retron-type reverse transcriptase
MAWSLPSLPNDNQEELVFRGHPDVVDADLADYFGSIPHADLIRSVARRVCDRRVLHLIKMWLDCPVEETDQRGRKTRTTVARDQRLAGHRGEGLECFHPPKPEHGSLSSSGRRM